MNYKLVVNGYHIETGSAKKIMNALVSMMHSLEEGTTITIYYLAKDNTWKLETQLKVQI